MKEKALFLDRDGVINFDYGYVCQINRLKFINNIFHLCKYAHYRRYLIIIVTNQSGIDRGLYSEKDFWKFMQHIENCFNLRKIKLTHTYFSPYIKIESVENTEFYQRKPTPEMLNAALNDYNIDPKRSIMIGDKISDMMAANSANIKHKLLFKRNFIHKHQMFKYNCHMIGNLREALAYLE